jgi:transcriptional regulator with GAF, ATPase, and Fis domain
VNPASGTGSAADYRARLMELLATARAAGVWSDLRPLLEAALAADALAAGAASDGAADRAAPGSVRASAIPIRYGMVGNSPALRDVFNLLDKIVASDVSVLIQGETGTGKELVAKALHEHGPRRGKPFLAENCAAVPAELLESELFGHKRGSFTGAFADRLGHFVAADKGTVFLDEIGDMPLAMQAKLLRVLQEGEVRPVGSNQVVRVDVRIIAASNKDLRAMCRAGTFREDLYFRLNVVTVALPPLRERKGDVAHLVRFFLQQIGREMGKQVELTPEALALLEKWRWPGNVRELENEIRRALALAPGTIGPEDLSPAVQAG